MKRFNAILMLLALSAIAIFALGGCSDDAVTPHDNPEITAEDAAYQGAAVTVAMVQVLEELSDKAVASERFVAEDYVYGSFWEDSDPDRVYTDSEHFLTVDFDGPPQDDDSNAEVTFDVTAATGLANGTGALDIGGVDITFTVNDVLLDTGNYPVGGQMIVSTSGHTATIEFFPGHTATVTVGAEVWNIDLDDGDITPA
ncbi:hypothetical protein KKG45_11675 [bacterium]|nr:hypothetical protein [bacterium]MBU1073895.1 hypothetical protein [bacterium]MBU1675920.1 hypothetical protein [bacterium]